MINFTIGLIIGICVPIVCFCIYKGIEYIINTRKELISAAEIRMNKHYIDIRDNPTFSAAVYDIPYADAVKVYMTYEKYRNKYIKNNAKFVKKQEKELSKEII